MDSTKIINALLLICMLCILTAAPILGCGYCGKHAPKPSHKPGKKPGRGGKGPIALPPIVKPPITLPPIVKPPVTLPPIKPPVEVPPIFYDDDL
ncbi:hypothetical protein CRG98_027037 [Punica granatum]|uniref:Uncharacterized protein n=1 Tax=Punica granatum TaxID=22663 RepID=A0A2I0J8J7_PUNGR|nr:hypothetical protein CRG98_027037 [Punica granatum]